MIEGVFTGSGDDDTSGSGYVLPPDDYEIDKKFEMVSVCVCVCGGGGVKQNLYMCLVQCMCLKNHVLK